MKRIQRDTYLSDIPGRSFPQGVAPGPLASLEENADRTASEANILPSLSPLQSNQPPHESTPTLQEINPTSISNERITSMTPPRRRNMSPSEENGGGSAQVPTTHVSNDDLKEIFRESEGLYALGTRLIQLLQKMQTRADLKHSLHLFVESDRGDAGGVPEGHPEVMHRVQTRIMFSPTLCASVLRQQSGLSRLYGELTHLSFQAAPSGSSYASGFDTTLECTTPRQQASSRMIPILSDAETPQRFELNRNKAQELLWPDGITAKFHKNFPKWCPFVPEEGETEYTCAPQNSKDHYLSLEKGSVEVFKSLKDFQVMWVYQELFLYMHRQGRILERSGQVNGMAKSITYSQFTPPWIRLNITVKVQTTAASDMGLEAGTEAGTETVTLKKAGLTDLRNERNTQGYRRLRFILAAFHSLEPNAVKPLLEYLLSIVPANRAQMRKKPKKTKRSSNNISTSCEDHDVEQASKRTKRQGTENSEDRSSPHLPRIQRESSFQTPDPVDEFSPSPPSINIRKAPSASERLNHRRLLSNAEAEQIQRRESVFGDRTRLLATEDANLSSGNDDENVVADTTTKPNDIQEQTSCENRINRETEKSSRARTQSNQEPGTSIKNTDCPNTPFSDDFDIHEDVDGSDDGLEKDPFSGVIKCGALAQCHWFLLPTMQDPAKMEKKCKKCNVPMHAQCYTRARYKCNVCAKKEVFAKIYEDERRQFM